MKFQKKITWNMHQIKRTTWIQIVPMNQRIRMFRVFSILLCWKNKSKHYSSFLKSLVGSCGTSLIPKNSSLFLNKYLRICTLFLINQIIYWWKHIVSATFIKGYIHQTIIPSTYDINKKEIKLPIVRKVVRTRSNRVPFVPKKLPARLYSFTMGAFPDILNKRKWFW